MLNILKQEEIYSKFLNVLCFFLYSIILLFKLCMMIPLFVLPSHFRVSLLRMLSSLFYFLISLVILFFKTEKKFLHSILLTYKEATQTFNIFCKFGLLNICIFFIKTRMTTSIKAYL